jgi:hypothetical protein
MKRLILIVLVLICFCKLGINQQSSLLKDGWGITAEIGVNSNRHNSAFASLSPNYALGFMKSISKKVRYEHFILFKFSLLNENLNNVPSSFINSSGAYVTESIKQKTTYPLLFLGWRVNRKLNEKLFLNAGLGFNYKLKSTFSTTSSLGTESITLPKSGKNFFFSNPEISLGLGYKIKWSNIIVNVIPRYRLNIGTVSAAGGNGVSNSPYIIHSIGIETNIIF